MRPGEHGEMTRTHRGLSCHLGRLPFFLCFVLLKNIFSNIDFSLCVVYAEKANVQGILPRKESQTNDSNTEKKHGNT